MQAATINTAHPPPRAELDSGGLRTAGFVSLGACFAYQFLEGRMRAVERHRRGAVPHLYLTSVPVGPLPLDRRRDCSR